MTATNDRKAAIAAAAARIGGHVRRTPVITVDGADLGLDGRLSLKLELLQHTGSFKPRGAFNTLLSADLPEAGVVAASGGNHGAAVAFAAARLGVPATIFVPTVASRVKVERIRGYGAAVTVAGDRYADALALAEAFAAESGALPVHAYDAEATIAGQGTIAPEWLEQAPDLDHMLVAVGGGGLIGGIAAACGDRVGVIAVEPAGCPALHAALAAGRPVDGPAEGIAANSLGARSIGHLPFAIAAGAVAGSVLVEDAAIVEAQRRLWQALRIAAEPGGATALAALVAGAWQRPPGARVGVLVCGGNVDLATLAGL